MINLEDYTQSIQEFITSSRINFLKEYGRPNSIGIYCCPWAGWISTNFNTMKTLEDVHYNCPNFEFVEFSLLTLNEWADEYDSDKPEYVFFGNKYIPIDEGNEELNAFFFNFLRPHIKLLKEEIDQPILIQFLDSTQHIVLR